MARPHKLLGGAPSRFKVVHVVGINGLTFAFILWDVKLEVVVRVWASWWQSGALGPTAGPMTVLENEVVDARRAAELLKDPPHDLVSGEVDVIRALLPKLAPPPVGTRADVNAVYRAARKAAAAYIGNRKSSPQKLGKGGGWVMVPSPLEW